MAEINGNHFILLKCSVAGRAQRLITVISNGAKRSRVPLHIYSATSISYYIHFDLYFILETVPNKGIVFHTGQNGINYSSWALRIISGRMRTKSIRNIPHLSSSATNRTSSTLTSYSIQLWPMNLFGVWMLSTPCAGWMRLYDRATCFLPCAKQWTITAINVVLPGPWATT